MVVIGADGAFCSEIDRDSFDASDCRSPIENKQAVNKRIHRVALAMDQIDKPVLAVVQGPTSGAGMDMALMADISLAVGCGGEHPRRHRGPCRPPREAATRLPGPTTRRPTDHHPLRLDLHPRRRRVRTFARPCSRVRRREPQPRPCLSEGPVRRALPSVSWCVEGGAHALGCRGVAVVEAGRRAPPAPSEQVAGVRARACPRRLSQVRGLS